MTRKASFPPVVGSDTRLLLLGSLPGEQSLKASRYYAHPQNQFWRLAGAVIGREDLPALDYDQRLAALLLERIGLWDVVADAERAGSLDAAIRDHRPNDLRGLIAELPALVAIGFNGGTAARIGRRKLGGCGSLTLVDLPSSSPAFTMAFELKRERWMALRRFLR